MLVNFLLGKRELFKQDEIIQFISTAQDFDVQREHIENAGALLLFQTLQQQTWLVATSERLYCVLDDIRRSEPEIRWTMSKTELLTDDNVDVDITTREGSENSGRINIGKHTGWLYSKALFSTVPVEEAIKALIQTCMIGGPAPEVRLDISILGSPAKARPQTA
jgi:hypothetical protein